MSKRKSISPASCQKKNMKIYSFLTKEDDKTMINFWLAQEKVDMTDANVWNVILAELESDPKQKSRGLTVNKLKRRWITHADPNLNRWAKTSVDDIESGFDYSGWVMKKALELFEKDDRAGKVDLAKIEDAQEKRRVLQPWWESAEVDLDGIHWTAFSLRLQEVKAQMQKLQDREEVFIESVEPIETLIPKPNLDYIRKPPSASNLPKLDSTKFLLSFRTGGNEELNKEHNEMVRSYAKLNRIPETDIKTICLPTTVNRKEEMLKLAQNLAERTAVSNNSENLKESILENENDNEIGVKNDKGKAATRSADSCPALQSLGDAEVSSAASTLELVKPPLCEGNKQDVDGSISVVSVDSQDKSLPCKMDDKDLEQQTSRSKYYKVFEGLQFHVLRPKQDSSDSYFIECFVKLNGGVIMANIEQVDEKTICIASSDEQYNAYMYQQLGGRLYGKKSLEALLNVGTRCTANDFEAYRYSMVENFSQRLEGREADEKPELPNGEKPQETTVEKKDVEPIKNMSNFAEDMLQEKTRDYRDLLGLDAENEQWRDPDAIYRSVNKELAEAAKKKYEKQNLAATKRDNLKNELYRGVDKKSRVFGALFRTIDPEPKSINSAAESIAKNLNRNLDKPHGSTTEERLTSASVRKYLRGIQTEIHEKKMEGSGENCEVERIVLQKHFDSLKHDQNLAEENLTKVCKFFKKNPYNPKQPKPKCSSAIGLHEDDLDY